MTKHPVSKEDLLRARVAASNEKFVALYLPYEFKIGALNYFYASMRLFDSMNGVPADDRILAPALVLYSHAVELLLKSLIQRIHFHDGEVAPNKELEASIASTYKHDLQKLHSHIESLDSSENLPQQLRSDIRELIGLLTQKHFLSVALRYGGNDSNDFEDSFSLFGLQGGLNQAWVKLYAFIDAVVDGELGRNT